MDCKAPLQVYAPVGIPLGQQVFEVDVCPIHQAVRVEEGCREPWNGE